MLQNLRRPFFVDLIGEKMQKSQRTTVLSAESQLKSLYLIVLAPVLGFFADTFGVWEMLLMLGGVGVGLYGVVRVKG